MKTWIFVRHKMINYTYVKESSVKLIPDNSRAIFFWIILVISVITLIGNSLAIISVVKRKQKCLQKVCIISLALADIFSVVMFAMNDLEALSKELKIWLRVIIMPDVIMYGMKFEARVVSQNLAAAGIFSLSLGDFLCHFIPMGQVMGTTASSFALLAIAVDRYQNVTVSIVNQRWNPNIWTCLLAAFSSWIVSSATAIPMFMFFTNNPIRIVHIEGVEPVFKDAYMCLAIEKERLMLYYIIMALFIFLPMIVIFIWFYYKIAMMIWRHRKPPASNYNNTFKTIDASISAEGKEKVSQEASPKSIIKKTKNAQMERKIRTFKIVIVLMLAFTLCRLPYWLYFVIKLVKTIKGSAMWDINYALTALNILNCALNPFLYAFLSETICAARKVHDFACKMILWCCCFTNSEFIEFEKNNPCHIHWEQKKYIVQKRKTLKNPRVKFIDVAHLSMYNGILPTRET